MQSNFTRLVFVLILSNCLIINKAVVSFRYAVFKGHSHCVENGDEVRSKERLDELLRMGHQISNYSNQ